MEIPEYTPLSDCVIIDPDPVKEYTEHMKFEHVVVPDKYKYGPVDLPITGKVVAKGPACKDPLVDIGSRVIIAKFGWAKIPVDKDTHHCLVREYDILAVLDD